MTNSLLGSHYLPPFGDIPIEDVTPVITRCIDEARASLSKMLKEEVFDWAWFSRLERQDDILDRSWSPISHLNSVQSSPQLRKAHDECVQLLTQWATERGQNVELYEAFRILSTRTDGIPAHHEAVRQALLSFRLSGVDLDEVPRGRVAEIKQRLALLSNQFSNNVLDATQAWYHLVEQQSDLLGLPSQNLEQAKLEAEKRGLKGFAITLDAPQYIAVMTFADHRGLRELCHRAFVSRASELGPHDLDYNNANIVDEILMLRQELSELLGFQCYAELSLAKKMAESVDQVLDLIVQLGEKCKPQAMAEFSSLEAFARTEGVSEIKPWDVTYYSERLRQKNYSVSEQELKPYFPVDKVRSGLFEVSRRLFGITFEQDNVATWHDDVKFYWVVRNNIKIAGFYLDLYAREGKRGGAWMDTCRNRVEVDGVFCQPIAYLTCNFAAPTESSPSLLSHNDVTTLFHEFGHGLHHMLTEVPVASVAGISGVAWDAVELPSQLLENWCWEPDVIPLISGNFETGETLPKHLLEKLLAAKNFQSALAMMRQLEFAYFDMSLHRSNPDLGVLNVLSTTRDIMTVLPTVEENRFPYSFSHIFAGGYAAGYYSYKWAEVLSADAYSLFEELGVFSNEASERFLSNILTQGGSKPAKELYRQFRGRDANIDALIRHSGIEV